VLGDGVAHWRRGGLGTGGGVREGQLVYSDTTMSAILPIIELGLGLIWPGIPSC
jgi:hypothetical protein